MIWTSIIIVTLLASIASLLRPLTRSAVFFLAVTLLVIISSIRYKTGYDFDAYVDMHHAILAKERLLGVEPGWIALNSITSALSDSPIGIFAISSLLIYSTIAWVLYKESKYASIGLLAFLLQLQFYWESLSIIRQYIAIALGVLAMHQWIIQKKINFLVFSLVATSFHAPAAVILASPLLTRWKSRTMFFAFAIAGGAILNYTLSKYLESINILEKYQMYFDGTISAEGNIATGLVIYIRLLIALFLILQIDKINHIDQNRKNLIANSLILGYALFFSFYESTALRRISYYFLIYEIFAVMHLAKPALQRKPTQQKYLAAGIIGIYLLFGATLLTKDVWTNPIGRQEDSQINYEYRTIFE